LQGSQENYLGYESNETEYKKGLEVTLPRSFPGELGSLLQLNSEEEELLYP
jgi:hypothetical protein